MPAYLFSVPRRALRYGVAVLAVAVATLLAWVTQSLNGPTAYLLYFAAVSVSSWYGRLGPTIVAIALSVLALDFFFLPPIFMLGLSTTDCVGLGTFALLAILINSLHARQHRLELVIATTQHELRSAGRIQQKFFPGPPAQVPGFDIAGVCVPANATGGDYFDFIPMADDCLGIAIGDVSGHGLGPALLMAETHAYLRALALVHSDVGTILTLTNQLVCQDTEDDQFITLFLARLDPRSRSLIYASAGHEGYLVDNAGTVVKLKSTGLALGIDNTEIVQNGPPAYLEGDQFVILFTDGVFEARSPEGTPFGITRALDLVCSNRNRTAQEIVELLCREVRDFAQESAQEDDITAVILKTTAA